jgi:D-arginine dehydrogenase
VTTATAAYRAPVVVNAAGAWAGRVAALAGALDIGLQPLKRTACLVDPPPGLDAAHWPMLKDGREQFYLKPDAGKLLLSPCDETLTEPADAQADEIDIAVAVDRVEQVTTLQVRRVSHRWAGLRSFVADRSPVVGYDPDQPGFFWLAALGGYGIQTAPALSRLAASLLDGTELDPDLAALGFGPDLLAPDRFAKAPA